MKRFRAWVVGSMLLGWTELAWAGPGGAGGAGEELPSAPSDDASSDEPVSSTGGHTLVSPAASDTSVEDDDPGCGGMLPFACSYGALPGAGAGTWLLLVLGLAGWSRSRSRGS